jgi:hypothetical protein
MIISALLPTEVVYRGRVHVVDPPDVRTALTVVSALPGAWSESANNDGGPVPVDGDWALLRETVRSWLPRALYRDLFPSPVREAARRVRRIWDGTHPDGLAVRLAALGALVAPPKTDGDSDVDRKIGGSQTDAEAAIEAASRNWTLALATYCQAYAVSPTEALGHPWPLFLQAVQATDVLDARAQLRLVEARAVGKLDERENDELVQRLLSRAWSEPAAPAAMTEEEQRAQLAQIRAVLGG